jgi:hypothetical protein
MFLTALICPGSGIAADNRAEDVPNCRLTEDGTVKSIGDFDLTEIAAGRSYYPSPGAWEDHLFYFLLVDRFADGRERPASLGECSFSEPLLPRDPMYLLRNRTGI